MRSSVAANEAALVAAGPCQGFRKLKTIQEVLNDVGAVVSVSSEDDLKERQQYLRTAANHWEELLASCKTALSELKRVSQKKTQQPKPKAKRSAGNKAAGRSLGQGDDGAYAILEMPDELPSVLEPGGNMTPRTPVLGQGMKLGEALTAAITQFADDFKKSDLRVMSGRAAQPLPKDLQEIARPVSVQLTLRCS